MKVLKFGASWCNGCLVMRPRWSEIKKENPWLKTEYFDFDKDKDAMNKYGIDSGVLPVFVFLNKDDKEILRLSGEVEKKDLIREINTNKDK
jgi:thiol-disulfide isomerase/thioredoxin